MTVLLAALLCAQDWAEIGRSVVALRSRSGVGSGFLVDDKGYLLTNAHVAACPLPFEVEVLDARSGGVVRFKRALLVGVHPDRDLALVKIDPAEHPVPLKALRFSGRPPSVEQAVHAIGYPHGSLRQVRTQGKVVATERVAYRRPYIEMDAEIHPGNSGGPVLDEEGAVIGVVTLKDPRENTGLAIPSWEYRPRLFVPLRQRAPDPAAATELCNGADRFMRIARDEGDMRAALFAVHLYERAISWDPGNATLLVKVGVFEGVRNAEIGAAYLFRALQINPWPDEGPDVYLALGALLASMGRKSDSGAVAQEGFAKYPDRSVSLFEILAEVHHDAKEWLDAARWSSMALRQGSQEPELMNKILQESRRRMGPQDTGRFIEEDDRYEPRMAELKREAEAARREGRAALTPKFKAFLDTFQGVQREGGDASHLGRGPSIAPDADLFTDDEVTRLFLEAQLLVAREHIRSGRLAEGRKVLEDLVRTSPKSSAGKEARVLLDLMKK